MTNSKRLTGRFKAEIAFDIDIEKNERRYERTRYAGRRRYLSKPSKHLSRQN